jgi:hypothetical protein
MSNAGETIGNTLKDYADKQTSANLKAVGVQVALMTGISLAVMLAFSFFRPREKKIYVSHSNLPQAPLPSPLSNASCLDLLCTGSQSQVSISD